MLFPEISVCLCLFPCDPHRSNAIRLRVALCPFLLLRFFLSSESFPSVTLLSLAILWDKIDTYALWKFLPTCFLKFQSGASGLIWLLFFTDSLDGCICFFSVSVTLGVKAGWGRRFWRANCSQKASLHLKLVRTPPAIRWESGNVGRLKEHFLEV